MMSRNAEPVRLSVVVPAFNEGDYLAGTLESLQRQNVTSPFEVIVVDNNSTDNTAAIAHSFACVAPYRAVTTRLSPGAEASRVPS